jgi:hypothetical protein
MTKLFAIEQEEERRGQGLDDLKARCVSLVAATFRLRSLKTQVKRLPVEGTVPAPPLHPAFFIHQTLTQSLKKECLPIQILPCFLKLRMV